MTSLFVQASLGIHEDRDGGPGRLQGQQKRLGLLEALESGLGELVKSVTTRRAALLRGRVRQAPRDHEGSSLMHLRDSQHSSS